MTDPNDIVERLRVTARLAQNVHPLFVTGGAKNLFGEAVDEIVRLRMWRKESIKAHDSERAEIVRLRQLVAELTPPQWADDTPVPEADAADEAHARLQAIADSHETLTVKWGVQFAEMIRNGQEGR